MKAITWLTMFDGGEETAMIEEEPMQASYRTFVNMEHRETERTVTSWIYLYDLGMPQLSDRDGEQEWD